MRRSIVSGLQSSALLGYWASALLGGTRARIVPVLFTYVNLVFHVVDHSVSARLMRKL